MLPDSSPFATPARTPRQYGGSRAIIPSSVPFVFDPNARYDTEQLPKEVRAMTLCSPPQEAHSRPRCSAALSWDAFAFVLRLTIASTLHIPLSTSAQAPFRRPVGPGGMAHRHSGDFEYAGEQPHPNPRECRGALALGDVHTPCTARCGSVTLDPRAVY